MSRLPTVWLAVALVAVACGGDSTAGDSVASGASATTVAMSADAPITVVDARGVEVTVESTERIVPLDGDVAEVVWALGLGDRVVATDISATYPEAADSSPKIGYQRALSPEPILDVEPTVVLATDLAGPPETLAQLKRVGVPVVMVPTPPTFEGPGTKIRAVAAALGVSEQGEQLASQVEQEMAAAVRDVDTAAPPVRMAALYLRGENVQLLLGDDAGIGWVIDAVGGVNIADELGVAESEPITAESIVAAAPEVIVVPQAGIDSVGGLHGLLAIGGIAQTPAAQNGRILVYDDQFLLGNGPRSGQLLDQLITDLYGAAP